MTSNVWPLRALPDRFTYSPSRSPPAILPYECPLTFASFSPSCSFFSAAANSVANDSLDGAAFLALEDDDVAGPVVLAVIAVGSITWLVDRAAEGLELPALCEQECQQKDEVDGQELHALEPRRLTLVG